MLPPPSAILRGIKTFVSTALVLFSLLIVICGLALDSNIADMGGPASECALLFLSLLLLAMNEGFQVGLMSTQHQSSDDIRQLGYSRAAKTHALVFEKGQERLKRLFIGQSFMVVTCSFLLAQLTTFPSLTSRVLLYQLSLSETSYTSSDASVGDTLFYVLVQSGLPGVVITVTFAQLLPSIFAKQYPESFLNILGIHSVIRVALWIEAIGIVKFVFVIFSALKLCLLSGVGGKSESGFLQDSSYHKCFMGNDTDDEERGGEGAMLEYEHEEGSEVGEEVKDKQSGGCAQACTTGILIFLSFCLTVFSVLFLGYGISHGLSSVGHSLPPVVHFLVLGLVLVVVFYCEGLKIAIVSTAHLDHVAVLAKGGSQRAVRVHQLLHPPAVDEARTAVESTEDGHSTAPDPDQRVDHVKRFLLGRQQLVVPLGFLFAQLTHLSELPAALPSPLYWPLVVVGMPGVLVLLQFAQLAPQLLAEERSVAFLGFRGAFLLTKTALLVESLGVTNFTWVLFGLLDRLMKAHEGRRSAGVVEEGGGGGDRLLSIELGSEQTFSFIGSGDMSEKLQYLPHPTQGGSSVSV